MQYLTIIYMSFQIADLDSKPAVNEYEAIQAANVWRNGKVYCIQYIMCVRSEAIHTSHGVKL